MTLEGCCLECGAQVYAGICPANPAHGRVVFVVARARSFHTRRDCPALRGRQVGQVRELPRPPSSSSACRTCRRRDLEPRRCSSCARRLPPAVVACPCGGE